jgi:hypothetical protein
MVRAGRNKERGGSKANLVLTILVLGVMILVGVKIIPVYVASYKIQDTINTETRFALTGSPKRTVDEIRDDVWQKSQELGIAAQKDAVHVDLGNGTVAIGLQYSVPIDIAVYQFTLEFNPHAALSNRY